jgi:hypothetical protein
MVKLTQEIFCKAENNLNTDSWNRKEKGTEKLGLPNI